MKYDLDHNQIADDLETIKQFFFGKKKQPAAVSVVDPAEPGTSVPNTKQPGFFEKFKDRMLLRMAEMGPMKVAKTVILAIVAIWVFVEIFLRADPLFKIITVIAFFFFYIWLFLPELKKEKEDLDKLGQTSSAHSLLAMHEARTGVQSAVVPGITGVITGAATSIVEAGRKIGGGGSAPAPSAAPGAGAPKPK